MIKLPLLILRISLSAASSAFLISSVFSSSAFACTASGALDLVDTGDSLDTLFNKDGSLGKIGGCSNQEVQIRRYLKGDIQGYVLCAKPSRDSKGMRILMVNGKVDAIRRGPGFLDRCAWGSDDEDQ